MFHALFVCRCPCLGGRQDCQHLGCPSDGHANWPGQPKYVPIPTKGVEFIAYYYLTICFKLVWKTINAVTVMLAVLKIIQKTINAVPVMPVKMY